LKEKKNLEKKKKLNSPLATELIFANSKQVHVPNLKEIINFISLE
jgi:hypothetical protein